MATAIGTRTLTQDGFIIHVFTSSGTFIPQFTGNVEVLVVAGGGGGGMDMGGGGGGGGVLTSTTFAVTSGTPVTVTVGAGGAGAPGGGENGQNTSHQFTIAATNGSNSVIGALTAIGGGKGGSSYFAYTPDNGTGGNGGSGGGASGYSDGNTGRAGTGTVGQGNNGGGNVGQYYAGGGGGAGGAGGSGTGSKAASGGIGVLNSILGIDFYWGGGGGGATYSTLGGAGGNGGGGSAATSPDNGGAGFNIGGPGGNPGSFPTQSHLNRPGGNGGQNTGGGGGGGSHYTRNNRGGNGGSGVVIIKYPASFGKTSTGGNQINISSLVFYYDVTNDKSWQGPPLTNSQASGGAEITPWTVGGINTDVTGTFEAGPMTNMKTWKFEKTGTSNQWNGWESGYGGIWTGSSGDIWTTSYWYKTAAPAGLTGFNVGAFVLPDWSRSYSATLLSNRSSIIADNTWRWNYSITQINEAYSNAIIADGPAWGYSTSAGTLYINGLQWNKNSYATPKSLFGTRSNSQFLLDQATATGITGTLTYPYDGLTSTPFSFNGSNTYLSFTNPITPSQAYTVIQWARPSTALIAGSGGTNPSGVNRRTPLVGPGPVWNPGIWVTSDNIRVHSNTDYRDLAITWTDTTYRMIGQTFDGSQSRIIYNGLVYTGASVGYSTSSPATILVGAETTTGSSVNWLGDIPITMFFKRVLTDSEIKQIFNAFRRRFGV